MKIKFSKKFTTFLIVVTCILLVLIIKILTAGSRGDLSQIQSGRVKGNPQTPVKIVEFIDFQCPSCAHGSKILKKFMAENPMTIQLELKYYPLNMHRHAFLSAYYAECAAHQGRFWSFEDLLIERQDQWSKLYDAKPYFDILAKDVGLNSGQLNACLKDPKVESIILAEREEGKKLGVQSTPTYFIIELPSNKQNSKILSKSFRVEKEKLNNGEMMVGVSLLQEKLNTFKQ